MMLIGIQNLTLRIYSLALRVKPTVLIIGHQKVILGLYWGYMGIMDKKTETTIEGLGLGTNLLTRM